MDFTTASGKRLNPHPSGLKCNTHHIKLHPEIPLNKETPMKMDGKTSETETLAWINVRIEVKYEPTFIYRFYTSDKDRTNVSCWVLMFKIHTQNSFWPKAHHFPTKLDHPFLIHTKFGYVTALNILK